MLSFSLLSRRLSVRLTLRVTDATRYNKAQHGTAQRNNAVTSKGHSHPVSSRNMSPSPGLHRGKDWYSVVALATKLQHQGPGSTLDALIRRTFAWLGRCCVEESVSPQVRGYASLIQREAW